MSAFEFDKVVIEAVGKKKKLDQEAVNKIALKIKDAAEAELNHDVYAKGIVDADNGGVMFTVKQPSLLFRVDYFYKCEVIIPEKMSDDFNEPAGDPDRSQADEDDEVNDLDPDNEELA